ncbi:unnamed protein product [Amoebophrya sp. A120]|nr:unnamed protein product [Amoebophrya sp. A120]|eukprot:GSA120T00008576001.1
MMWLSTFFTHGSRSTTIGSTSRPVLAVVGVVGLLLLFLSIAGITQIAEAIQPGALVTGSTTEASTSLITSTKRSSGGVPPGDGPLPPAGATLLPGEQEQEVDKAKNSVLTTLDPPNPGADEASKERSFAAEHKNDHNAAHLAGAEQPSSSAPATAFSWLQYQHLLPSWLGGGGGRSGGQQALSSAGTATPRRFGNLRGSKNKHARAQEALAGGTPTDGGAVPSSSLTPEDLPGGSSPFSPDAAMPAEQEASALSRRSSDLLSDDAPMEFRSDAGDGGGNQFAAGSGTKRGAENAGFLEKEKATGNTNANSAAAQARVEHQNENTYCNGDSCSSPSPSSTTGTTGRTTAAAGRSTAVQQQEQLQQQQQLHASPSVVSTGTTSTPDVERLQKELRAALGKVTELDKALKNAQTKIHQLEEEKARSAAREEFVIELEQHVAYALHKVLPLLPCTEYISAGVVIAIAQFEFEFKRTSK